MTELSCWAGTIGISTAQGLAFGKFAAGSGGTVTVTPAGGRTANGGVTLVPSGAGSVARFSISGDTNATFAISLPVNGTVFLSSGSNTMAVNNFVSSPAQSGTLSGGGSQVLSVGATLGVGAGQPVGQYSGVFNVSVDYN